MFRSQPSKSDEVEHLLRNAQLRDELEPLFDESIGRVNPTVMTTRSENEFLESMLEWERAPMLPISQWFEPPLMLPHPDRLERPSAVARAAGDDREAVREARGARLHRSPERLPALLPRSSATFCRRTKRSSIAARRYLHWDCANIDDNPATVAAVLRERRPSARCGRRRTTSRCRRAPSRPIAGNCRRRLFRL